MNFGNVENNVSDFRFQNSMNTMGSQCLQNNVRICVHMMAKSGRNLFRGLIQTGS